MRQVVKVGAETVDGKTRFDVDIYHDGVLIDFHNVGSMWVAKAIEDAYVRGLADGKQYVRDQVALGGMLNPPENINL